MPDEIEHNVTSTERIRPSQAQRHWWTPYRERLDQLPAPLRKAIVAVVGITVILIGVALLVLPGPGWLTIFAGLGILATEFAWAAWCVRRAKREVRRWWPKSWWPYAMSHSAETKAPKSSEATPLSESAFHPSTHRRAAIR